MTLHSLSDRVPEDCQAKIRRAVEYWLSVHPAGGLPGRQHFDPVDVPELLPYVRLLDVSDTPPKFKVRLMGTGTVEFYGKDLTGFWYHDAFPDFPGSDAESLMIDAVRTGRPNWRKGAPSFFHKKDYQNVERVTLPFATDGRNVDMLLIVHVFN